MLTQEIALAEAIQTRKPIEFTYQKEGKVIGVRRGNPHILFSGRTKDDIARTWVHIAQTGGVSDTLTAFPDWRMFITEYIQNVKVLAEEPPFSLQEGYDPDSDFYDDCQIIAKA